MASAIDEPEPCDCQNNDCTCVSCWDLETIIAGVCCCSKSEDKSCGEYLHDRLNKNISERLKYGEKAIVPGEYVAKCMGFFFDKNSKNGKCIVNNEISMNLLYELMKYSMPIQKYCGKTWFTNNLIRYDHIVHYLNIGDENAKRLAKNRTLEVCKEIITAEHHRENVLHFISFEDCLKSLKFILEHAEYTTEFTRKILKSKSYVFTKFHDISLEKSNKVSKIRDGLIEIYSEIIDRCPEITEEIVIIICENYAGRPKLFEDALKKFGQATIQILEKACEYLNSECIRKVLDQRVIPNKKCFMNVFCSGMRSREHAAEIVDILIGCGYILEPNDVTYAMSKGYGYHINNLQRFDFKLSTECFIACRKQNYFPYKYLKIDQREEEIYAICATGKLPELKEYINQHNIKPDVECIRYACKRTGNTGMLRYLIETHKIKPDIECLKELVKVVGNPQLKYLASKL